MFTCPRCRTALTERKSPPLGLIWTCSSCHGRAMTLDLLRKTIPKSLVNPLWQQARTDRHHTGRPCPACERQMAEVPIIRQKDKTLCLDVCTTCFFVWFDPQEFEVLPKLEQKPDGLDNLSEEGKRALALAHLEVLRQGPRTQEEEALDIANRWQIALDILWLVLRILIRW